MFQYYIRKYNSQPVATINLVYYIYLSKFISQIWIMQSIYIWIWMVIKNSEAHFLNFNSLPPQLNDVYVASHWTYYSDPFLLRRIMKLGTFTIILFNSYLISAKEKKIPRQCKCVAFKYWINFPPFFLNFF